MATDELDLVDEIFGPAPGDHAEQPASREPISWEPTPTAGSTVAVGPRVGADLRGPLTRRASARARLLGLARLVLVFAIALIVTLILVAGAALAAQNAYSNRVFPGVRVGSVDVSGLSREEVIARLQTAYAYLGQGEITVTTPVGVATITYQQAGRGPDVDVMADAAMKIGHTGNPIGDAVFMLRSAIDGQSVPSWSASTRWRWRRASGRSSARPDLSAGCVGDGQERHLRRCRRRPAAVHRREGDLGARSSTASPKRTLRRTCRPAAPL